MVVGDTITDGGAVFKVRSNKLNDLLNLIYPVGCIFITTADNVPFGGVFGTWQEVAKGKTLWGGDNAGEEIEAGLPDIQGMARMYSEYNLKNYDVVNVYTGAFKWTKENEDTASRVYGTSTNQSEGSNDTIRDIEFKASKSNAIYGNSATVQPPALVVHFWQRVS